MFCFNIAKALALLSADEGGSVAGVKRNLDCASQALLRPGYAG